MTAACYTVSPPRTAPAGCILGISAGMRGRGLRSPRAGEGGVARVMGGGQHTYLSPHGTFTTHGANPSGQQPEGNT